MPWIVANFAVLSFSALTSGVGAWTLVLLLWTNLFIFAVRKITKRAFLTAFLIAFFLFLMTMDTFERLFSFRPVSVAPEAHEPIVWILLLALGGLAGGYALPRLWRSGRNLTTSPGQLESRDHQSVSTLRNRHAALVIFCLAVPMALIGQIQNISAVRASSYAGSYTEEFVQAQSGALATVAYYAAGAASVAFAVYLATLPSFKAARVPIFVWVAFAGMRLFTGQRRDVAVLLLFLVCYAIARNRITPEDPWVRRRGAWMMAASLPLVAILFGALESFRGLGAAQAGFSVGAIMDFLYGQGISVKVLENVVMFGDLLPEQLYVAEFTHSGIAARLLGVTVLEGNSVARALEGGSLSHSLSYIVLGQGYLGGISTGTSFVAEWFVNFGYGGVIFVSVVYGLLLRWADGVGAERRPIGNVARLLVAQSLIWAPRGSSTGFLTTLTAPITWATLLLIWLVTRVLRAPAVREASAAELDPRGRTSSSPA